MARIDAGQQPADQRIGRTQRAGQHRWALVGRNNLGVNARANQIGRLDQHHRFRVPHLVERSCHRVVVESHTKRRSRIISIQRRTDPSRGHSTVAVHQSEHRSTPIRPRCLTRCVIALCWRQLDTVGIADNRTGIARTGQRSTQSADIRFIISLRVSVNDARKAHVYQSATHVHAGASSEDLSCCARTHKLARLERRTVVGLTRCDRLVARTQRRIAACEIRMNTWCTHRKIRDRRTL